MIKNPGVFAGAGTQRRQRFADGAQRVDVETRIGLVENCVLRREDRKLQHLETLFLATRKPVVDVAAEERRVDAEMVELLEDERTKLGRRQIAAADRSSCGAQKIRDAHARDCGRILKRKKQAKLGSLVG